MTDLRITSPCAADWNAMSPVSGGRHCSLCAKTVVDLTCLAPSQHEVELARIATLVQAGKRVCIRTSATRDGRVLSASRRILTGGMAAMLAMTVAGCQDSGTSLTSDPVSGETRDMPILRGEAHNPRHMLGKPSMGDVAIGEMAIEPPEQKEPVAPHAAQ